MASFTSTILLWMIAIPSSLALTNFCMEPLGLENKVVADSQLTASSSLPIRLPQEGRLNDPETWCANDGAKLGDTYLQVDLGQSMTITQIATQGDRVYGPNFVTEYRIMYSLDGIKFHSVTKPDNNNDLHLSANEDNNSVKKNAVSFTARYVQIVPTANNQDAKHICMRIELYGCPYVCSNGFGIEGSESPGIPNGIVLSASSNGNEASKARLKGPTQWCASSTTNQYLEVDLGKVMTVTGIAVQGHASSNKSVTSFKIQQGVTKGDLSFVQLNGAAKTFIGGHAGDEVVVNWFNPFLETRFVRLIPETWIVEICIRIELLGCKYDCLRPLGMEQGVIPDSAISVSSRYNSGRVPATARLHSVPGWCAQGQDVGREWVSIDLGVVLNVGGIAIQGDPGYGPNQVKKYQVEYSFNGQDWLYVKGESSTANKDFTGNTNNIVVNADLFPQSDFSARYVRLRPTEFVGNHQCLRIEIFGCSQYCSGSLGIKVGSSIGSTTLSSSTGSVSLPTARLGATQPWCTQDNNQFIEVQFQSAVLVGGIALQGDPNGNNWVTKFVVEYGVTGSLKKIQQNDKDKVFHLVGGRDVVTNIWFPTPVSGTKLRIFPTDRMGRFCLRLDALGCKKGCLDKLGLESSSVQDGSFSASSSFDSKSLPKASRLNQLSAWISCRSPSNCGEGSKETSGSKEWIEVCLDKVKAINGLILQGGGDRAQAFVRSFTLRYKYTNVGSLHGYRRDTNFEVFSPSLSRYSATEIILPLTLVAKCLRLQVESFSGTDAALRWELLGCDSSAVPTVSTPSTLSVAREAEATISCSAKGQPGVFFKWTKDGNEITPGGIFSFTATTSSGTLSGTTHSGLKVKAVPKELNTAGGSCSETDAQNAIFKCVVRFKCAARYPGLTAEGSSLVDLDVTNLRGKAGKPLEFKHNTPSVSSITFSWKVPTDTSDFPLKHYHVEVAPAAGGAVLEKRLTATTVSFDGLKAYTRYSVKITFVNSKDVASDPLTGTFQTDEGRSSAPVDVTTSSPASDTAVVQWKAPLQTNGNLAKYRVRYTSSGREMFVDNINKDKLDTTIKGLEAFTTYMISVQAFTKTGKIEGEWSQPVQVTTAEGKATAPENPKIDNGSNGTHTFLSWSTPKKLRGRLKHYKVNVSGKKAYNVSFVHTQELTAPTTSTMVRTFGGTDYVFLITAETGGGLGEKANLSISTQPAEPPVPFARLQRSSVGFDIQLHPASDLNGRVSRYEVIVFQSPASLSPCNGLKRLPRPSDRSTGITPNTFPYKVQIPIGQNNLVGANISLPIVGNFTMCYRAVVVHKTQDLFGLPFSVTFTRKGLPKPPRILDSAISSSTFTINVEKGPGSGIRYYQICVIELENRKSVQVHPDEYPPSLLGPYKGIKGIPYIAAEFPARDYDRLKSFVVGDGQSYSRQARRRRNAGAASTYVNVALKPGSTYSSFQRALESPTSYYTGPWMEPVSTTKAPGGKKGSSGVDAVPVAVGASVAVVLVIVIIIAAFLIKRRMTKRDNGPQGKPASSLVMSNIALEKQLPRDPSMGIINPVPVTNDEAAEDEESSTEDGLRRKTPPTSVVADSRYPAVAVNAFPKHCEQMKRDSHYALSEEYNNLSGGQQYPWDYAMAPQNKPKNRFANIAAYDHSRVKLIPQSSDSHSDYINANFIKSYDNSHSYIASQGPVAATMSDFWRMVWDHNVPAIVMLTNLIERGKKKCEKYWPAQSSETFGEITVQLIKEETYAEYAIRNLTMKRHGYKDSRHVSHFHFISWPDHGVPEHPTDLLNLQRRFRNLFPVGQVSNPVIVHCSAGVGRTGTFIVIDAMLRLARTKKIIDIFNYVNYIRSQRIHMVQTEEQYLFVYDAILEAITCGMTEISAQNIRLEMNTLQGVKSNNKSGYQSQFERLKAVSGTIYESESVAGKKKSNRQKNRHDHIIPKDSFRVVLRQSAYVNDDLDYINATFVNGYKRKDAFIATHHPLPDTLDDFWNMIYQQKCGTVVMLNKQAEGKEVYPSICPDLEGSQLYGTTMVSLVEIYDSGTMIRKTISLHNINSPDDTRECDILHYYMWPNHTVPKDPGSVVQLLSEVEKSQQQYGNVNPTVVMCSDGAGRTGAFIAMIMLLDRFKVEGLIDVFQTVKKIRFFRPNFVENVGQYIFCHEVILAYIDSFSDYGNFRM